MAADLLVGGTGLGDLDSVIFLKLRLPRMLTAVLAGAGLGLAGLQMQSLFRNPLADPHIMGVSAGAGTGAAVAILVAGGSSAAIPVVGAAFAGAALSAGLIVLVSARIRNSATLLIFGIMLGFVMSAVTAILEYSANAESLKMFYSWSAGSFSGNDPTSLTCIAGAFLVAAVLALSCSHGLDIALFGDDYAALSGTDLTKTRSVSMAGSCLVTGAVTAFCGPLGFVGIVAPHIARAIAGTSVHRKVIPTTVLTGASIALLADILSQVFPTPLPVGSTMALVGIPVILAILMRS